MSKNIICFFSFPFITWNVFMGRVRESRVWQRCAHILGQWYCSSVKPLCIYASFCQARNLPRFISFSRNPDKSSWSHFPPTHCMWASLLLACHPLNFMWHFDWETNNILFTFGNGCTSCYALHATYVACQRDLPVNIHHFKCSKWCLWFYFHERKHSKTSIFLTNYFIKILISKIFPFTN